MNYYIVVFKNTHDAISGEKILKELKFVFRIMPTPTIITQSCGICIRIEDEAQINKIIETAPIAYKAIYKKGVEGYVIIDGGKGE